jgi:hypothetical protein
MMKFTGAKDINGGGIVAEVSCSDADGSTQRTPREGTAPGDRWPA